MHAILITAYKDFPVLVRLVERLDQSFFKIYVHVDRRSTIGPAQLDKLKALGCQVCKLHAIKWGSFSHLRAIMELIQRALGAGGVDYLHIISGQDYPIHDKEYFERLCDGRIFLSLNLLDSECDYVKSRYRIRNIFGRLETVEGPLSTMHRYLDTFSRSVQTRFETFRTHVGPFSKLYKGTVWSSLPANAAESLIDDPISRKFFEATRTTYLAEEIFLQTYFMGSKFRDLVVSDDLRFVDWRPRNGSVPAVLDLMHLRDLSCSKALFARKMSSDVSAALLDWIDTTRFPSVGRSL